MDSVHGEKRAAAERRARRRGGQVQGLQLDSGGGAEGLRGRDAEFASLTKDSSLTLASSEYLTWQIRTCNTPEEI